MTSMKNELQCLKYEVKKLKELKTQISNIDEIFKQFEQYKHGIEEINKENSLYKEEREKILKDLRIVKYQIYKIKNFMNNNGSNDNQHNQSLNLSPTKQEENDFRQQCQINSFLPDTPTLELRENSTLKNDLRCIKYEIKKLKDQISTEKIVTIATRSTLKTEEIKTLKDTTTLLIKENDRTQKDLKAIKLQLNRLKNHSVLNEEITTRDISIDQTANNEQFNLKKELHCIKYEIKILKQKSEQDDNISPNGAELYSRIMNDLSCVKYEVKKLKEQSSTSSRFDSKELKLYEEEQEKIQKTLLSFKLQLNKLKDHPVFKEENEDKPYEETTTRNIQIDEKTKEERTNLKRELHCIKYEIKLLKQKSQNDNNDKDDQTKHTALIETIHDLTNEVSETRKEMSQAIEKTAKFEEENSQMKKELKCINYELKKLKGQKDLNNEASRSIKNRANDTSDLIERLDKAEKKADEAKEEIKAFRIEQEQMQKYLRSIKLQLNQLKEHAVLNEENNHKPSEEIATRDIQIDEKTKEERTNLKRELHCIKYEIKLLKQKSQNDNDDKVSSDLFERLDATEKKAEATKEEQEKIQKDIKIIKYHIAKIKNLMFEDNQTLTTNDTTRSIKLTSPHVHEDKSLKDDIGCLKYEVKRLKSQTNQLSNKDEILELFDQHKREIERMSKESSLYQEEREKILKDIRTIKYHIYKIENNNDYQISRSLNMLPTKQEDNESHQYLNISVLPETPKTLRNDLRCIKYEIKKLKDIYQEKVSKDIKVIKYHISKLKELNANENRSLNLADNEDNQENQTVNLSPLNDRLKEEIRCLKYEVKKLKNNRIPLAENEEVSSEILKRLSTAENNAKKANETANKAQKQIRVFSEENNKLKNDLSCVKYEVKRLKERQISPMKPVQERSSVPIDFNEENTEQPRLLKRQISCMKYEIKKLKERSIQSITDRMNPIYQNSLPSSVDVNAQKLLLEQNQLKRDLSCIKYEVKKLKWHSFQSSAPIKTRSIGEANSIPNDFLQRLENAERNSNEVFDQNKRLRLDNDKLKREIRCIKYEMKKLKERPTQESVPESTTRTDALEQTVPNDIKQRLSAVERSIKSLQNKQGQLKNDLSCVKYEVKRLKSNQNQVVATSRERSVETTNNIPDDLIDRLTKNENKSNEALQQNKSLRIENDNFKKELRCIKYEVKKLKSKPTTVVAPLQERSIESRTSIPDDLLERLENAENKCNESHSQSKEALNQAKGLRIENDKLKSELRCIKYEIKKLIERPTPESTISTAPVTKSIPNDLVKRISAVEQNIDSLKGENEELKNDLEERLSSVETNAKKLNHDLSCVKYEVKKMKSKSTQFVSPPQERSIESPSPPPSIPDDLLDRLSTVEQNINSLKEENEELKNDLEERLSSVETNAKKHEKEQEQLNHGLSCVKYEVKKLKSKPTQIVSPPQERSIESPSPPSIPDDLLDRLSTVEQNINSLKEENEELKNDLEERLSSVETNTLKVVKEQEQHNHDLSCIKYEVKKLKSKPAHIVTPPQERSIVSSPSIPDDLLDRLSTVEQDVNSLREKNEELKNDLEERLSSVETNAKKLKNDLEERLISVETNTLKIVKEQEQHNHDLEEHLSSVETSTQKTSDDLLNRIEQTESITNKSQEQIKSLRLENDKLKSELRCIKYEIKKLKEKPIPESPNVAPVDNSMPNDFEERLSSIEQNIDSIREENEELKNDLEERLSSVETNTQKLEKEQEQLNHDLSCVKYEVKKLKSKPAQVVTLPQERSFESPSPPSIPDDLLDRLSTVEQNINSLKEENEELKNDLEERLSSVETNSKKLKNDLSCVKYEVKKLKSKSVTAVSPPQERSIESSPPTIPDDLLERLEEAENISKETQEQTSGLRLENDKLKNELRCIKYEIKKIKERPNLENNENSPIESPPPSIPSYLLDRLSTVEQSINSLKEENEELKNDLEERLSSVETNAKKHEKEQEQLNHGLSCVKYEVKKLKSLPVKTVASSQESSIESPSIPDDLEERLSEIEQTISTIHQLSTDINCIKNELKKLKEQSHQEASTEDSQAGPSTPSDLEERLSSVETNTKKLKNNLSCVKYEVKKLKSHQESSTDLSNKVPDDLLDRVEQTENISKKSQEQTSALRRENDKIKSELRCIKYEIKKLKERSIQSLNENVNY